jgi:hypothetical protein
VATAIEIASLRQMIAEEDAGSSDFSDDDLEMVIDADPGNLRLAAAVIWEQKAAAAAALVDTTESGSSRRLGSLYNNYLAMAKQYRAAPIVADAEQVRNATSRRIVRR